MSTEYEMFCKEHDKRWPEGGIYYHNLPSLFDVASHTARSWIKELSTIPELRISIDGAYDDINLADFFKEHAGCSLYIRDEYGYQVNRNGERLVPKK